MNLQQLSQQKAFLITSEIAPPKGADCASVLEKAEKIAPLVDALNVTDGQSAIMRMGSLPVCHMLQERGINPVFQLTCRDRNRIALQSELLNASALGIPNVLCLTGDHVFWGDHPEAKPVFDLDSVSLLSAVQRLNAGLDINQNKLNAPTNLCAGAVVNPNADPAEPQLLKMERKLRAGAAFIQSQAIFEISRIEEFSLLAEGYGAPFLMGVMLLKSPAMANYVNNKIPGIEVPADILSRLNDAPDPIQVGIDIAAELVKAAKDICQGVHIMTNGREDLVEVILDRAMVL